MFYDRILSPVPGYVSAMCVYKGTAHQQGDSWDDGCDYTCTCTDGAKGLYTCTTKYVLYVIDHSNR